MPAYCRFSHEDERGRRRLPLRQRGGSAPRRSSRFPRPGLPLCGETSAVPECGSGSSQGPYCVTSLIFRRPRPCRLCRMWRCPPTRASRRAVRFLPERACGWPRSPGGLAEPDRGDAVGWRSDGPHRLRCENGEARTPCKTRSTTFDDLRRFTAENRSVGYRAHPLPLGSPTSSHSKRGGVAHWVEDAAPKTQDIP